MIRAAGNVDRGAHPFVPPLALLLLPSHCCIFVVKNTMTITTRSLTPRASDQTPVSELGVFEIVRRLPVTTWSLRPNAAVPSIALSHETLRALHALGRLSGWIDASPWIPAIAHRLGARYEFPSPLPSLRVTTAWLGVASDSQASIASVPPPPSWLPSIVTGWNHAIDPASLPTTARGDFALRSASWTLWLFATTQPFGGASEQIACAHAARLIASAAGLSLPIIAGRPTTPTEQKSHHKLLVNAHSATSFAQWHTAWLTHVSAECDSQLHALQRFGVERARILAIASEMRAPIHCIALAHALVAHPELSVADAARHMQLTFRAAQAIVDKFVAENVMREITGRRRDRRYQCDALSDQMLFASQPARLQ